VPFRKYDAEWVLPLDTHSLAILRSKPWIRWLAPINEKESNLLVKLSSTEIIQRKDKAFSLLTSGEILQSNKKIAEVSYQAEDVKANIPHSLFQRLGKPREESSFFAEGGYQLLGTPDVTSSPDENHTYAFASRDFNPIHTNPLFATLASLPSTITHGMWFSANARRVIESYVANDQVRSFLLLLFLGIPSSGLVTTFIFQKQ